MDQSQFIRPFNGIFPVIIPTLPVQGQQISVTRRSKNIREAYKNYMWKTDRDGNILSEPDHYMSDAMDAIRYGLSTYRPQPERKPAGVVGRFDPFTGRRLD